MSEKLRKFLVMAAGVLVILETTVISGCRANISGTPAAITRQGEGDEADVQG